MTHDPRKALDRRLSTLNHGENHDAVLASYRPDDEVRERHVDRGRSEPRNANKVANEQNGNAHVRMEVLGGGNQGIGRHDAGGGVREAFVSVLASLAAAISLLERMPKAKKAAPSDTMFAIMLDDYRKALETGRAAIYNPPAAVESNASVEARLREALEHYAKEYCEGWCEQDAGCANFDHDCGGCLARRALSAVGDEAKKSALSFKAAQNTAESDPSVTPDCLGADTGGRDSSSLPSGESDLSVTTGYLPPDPTADRREIVARALMDKWPGDYAWGDDRPEPNPLAFETADAILAALDGVAGE